MNRLFKAFDILEEGYDGLVSLPHNKEEMKKVARIKELERELAKLEEFKSPEVSLTGSVLISMVRGGKIPSKHYMRSEYILELKEELALRKKRYENHKKNLDLSGITNLFSSKKKHKKKEQSSFFGFML